MRLDLDAYLADMVPPTLVISGTEYRGTALLSFNDAVQLQQRMAADPSGVTLLAVAQELCQLVGIPPEVILPLPGAAISKLCLSFFELANQTPEPSS